MERPFVCLHVFLGGPPSMCLLNFLVSIQSCIFTWKKFHCSEESGWARPRGWVRPRPYRKSLCADRSCGEITAPQEDTIDVHLQQKSLPSWQVLQEKCLPAPGACQWRLTCLKLPRRGFYAQALHFFGSDWSPNCTFPSLETLG